MPLPELPPWRGAEGGTPEIEVRLGNVPDQLPDIIHRGPILQIGGDGSCRYNMAGVACFLIEGGRRITVRPHMAADAPDVRLFLLGSVFGLLCHQRGWLPLHACCVEIGGRAIAFAGPSGIGKSTLAASFVRQGYRLLADDVTVIDAHAPGGPLVIPAIGRIKLWRDTLDALKISADGLEPCRNRMEKFQVPVGGRFQLTRLPLTAIHLLDRVSDERQAELLPLVGLQAVETLLGAVYRRQAGERMGKRPQMLRAIHRLLTVPILALRYAQGLSHLQQTVYRMAARYEGRGE
ncbi:MAG: hypothetical protein J0H82_06465 [Alphaproteobacteria bacterium]|jgi:hypothetical protein|nr:hypothetical protein [Alphaproteobacteria bacterium]